MLTHSVSQLRQIKLSSIHIPRSKDCRTASSAAQSSSTKSFADDSIEDRSAVNKRPHPFRSRSTRGNPYGEPSTSRLQRFEAAISKHSYESFFVLYDGRETLYLSEVQSGTTPAYLPFHLDNRAQSLAVVVYARLVGRPWQTLCRYDLSFQQLCQINENAHTTTPNQIFLQFEDDVWFGTCEDNTLQTRSFVPRLESYTFNQVMRLQTSTEVINDALYSIAGLRDDLAKLLQEANDRIERVNSLELCRSTIADVKTSSKSLSKQSIVDRAKIKKIKDANQLRASLLSDAKLHMSSTKSDLDSSRKSSLARRPALNLLSSELRRLQRQLTTSLTEIYPIVISSHETRIRGLKPARNSDYWMQNHEESAALGYIAHFIFLLSHYLGIPLRYPVRPASSHSYIMDPISIMPESSDVQGGPPYSIKRDRRFPLFYERGGVDRLQWGAFLLNKNIEQLLQGRGLVCGDLRDSLPNLNGLVVWLVSVNEDEDLSLTRPRRQVQLNNDLEIDDTLHAVEITDHEDLLAAQLRSRVKGKRRMTLVSEKDEDIESLTHAIEQVSVA